MFKRLAFLTLLMAYTIFAADQGTADNPILIENEADLVSLRDAINAGSGTLKNVDISDGAQGLFFKLDRDLDLSAYCGKNVGNWNPIGTRAHPFKGNFDGNGKTIDYLYISESRPARDAMDTDPFGLFGYIESEQTSSISITNLTIGENSLINVESNGITGSIIGWANNNVIISNCVNKARVSGRLTVGGIVGSVTNPTLSNNGAVLEDCVNEGTVQSSVGKAGGIAGLAEGYGIFLDRCVNTGFVSASDTAAGIVAFLSGANTSSTKFNELINKGDITSGKISGGIVAVVREPQFTIANSFNSGNVKASSTAGGIVAHLNATNGPNVLTCVNNGNIFAGSIAGGIVGFQTSADIGFSGTLTQTLNLGMVGAAMSAGGIIGRNDYTYFVADHNMNVGIIYYASNAGGIAGSFSSNADKVTANLSIGASDSLAVYDAAMAYFEEGSKYPTKAANAHKTAELVSGKKIDALGDSLWIYRKGYYPQIKGLVNNTVKEIREAQALAATPIFLKDADKVQSITGEIKITTRDPQDSSVTVKSKFGLFTNSGSALIQPQALGLDTLQISNGELAHIVIVDIKSLSKMGTYDNPITISSVEEFLQFKEALANSAEYKGVLLDNNGTRLAFKLTNDLDLSSVCGPDKGSWTPIANFRGKFNGDNHKISNLYIKDANEDQGGLFTNIYATSGDTNIIENISFENVHIDISGQKSVGAFATSIAGNVAIVRNVSAKGYFKSNGDVGGIIGSVGLSDFHLLNNKVDGEIVALKDSLINPDNMYTYSGGIIGGITGTSATIKGNTNHAKIYGERYLIGGIAGYVSSQSIIENNTNDGDITDSNSISVGGLFGLVTSANHFVNNHNKGSIHFKGTHAVVGGVAGQLTVDHVASPVLDNVSNEGSLDIIANENHVGGLFGYYSFGHADNLKNLGDIKVHATSDFDISVGGILGKVVRPMDTATFATAINEGSIEVLSDSVEISAYVGGILGNMEYTYLKIEKSLNKGNVSVNLPKGLYVYTGGIVGLSAVDEYQFESTYNYGDITALNGNVAVFAGGIAGKAGARKTQNSMNNCGNEGTITASKKPKLNATLDIGGIFGTANALQIKNAYNKGKIHAGFNMEKPISTLNILQDNVGGLMGSIATENQVDSMKIDNAINIGNIIYESTVSNANSVSIGGILGTAQNFIGVTKNYNLLLNNVANYGSIQTASTQENLSIGGLIGFVPMTPVKMQNIINGGSFKIESDSKCMVHASFIAKSCDTTTTNHNISSALAHGSFFVKNPVRYYALDWKNVVADKQFAILDTHKGFAQYSSSELTGKNLPISLDSENWIQVDGYYPQLKALANSSNETIRKISALGATPVFLSSEMDRADSVTHSLKLPQKNALGATAKWSIDAPKVLIENNVVSFEGLNRDTLVTLTVESDSITKNIVLYVAQHDSIHNNEDAIKYHPTIGTNRLQLVHHGLGSWSLDFAQEIPSNVKVSVMNAAGIAIPVKVQYGSRSILLHDVPQGILLIHVKAPGISKKFMIQDF